MIRRARRPAAVMLLAATIIGAVIVAACGGVHEPQPDRSDDGGELAGGFEEDPGNREKAGVKTTASAAEAPASASDASPSFEAAAVSASRRIIFSAGLTLRADDVPAAFTETQRLARSLGGFVESSSLARRRAEDGLDRPFGTITLRVPAERYGEALTSLRSIVGVIVEREESSSSEVTEQYTDLESRQRNLERSEAQYLKLLEQAHSVTDIMAVGERIDGIRGQIEQVQGRIRVLDDLTDLATITVSLLPVPDVAANAHGSGTDSPREAFERAWDWSMEALRVLAAGAAMGLVALIWLSIPAALVVGGATVVRRRRRHLPATPAA